MNSNNHCPHELPEAPRPSPLTILFTSQHALYEHCRGLWERARVDSRRAQTEQGQIAVMIHRYVPDLLQSKPAQTERVRDDRHGTERHCGACDHWAQENPNKRIEY